MGSASRDALAQARSALSASLDQGAGTELLRASAEIGAAPALAAALGDPSADAAQKTAVVDRLFGSMSAGARGVLHAAVSGRWSDTSEFVEGVEELGLRAEAIATEQLSDELLAVADLVDRNHELQLTLGSKLGDPAGKVGIVRQLLSGKVSESALAVVSHLVANPRGRRLDATLRLAARTVADERGSELATVTVAAPLTPAQEERLAALLAQSAGRPVTVTTIIDPEIVGGVHVQLGDNVIDGSVRARLDDLRQQLAA